MKYWKEKEKNPLEEMHFWTGTHITKLAENEIFLYGSNPQGINGAGAAKAAMSLSKGAKNGVGRGFNGSNAYALVTKSLNAGFLEKSTGILYDKEGYRSVSPEQIRKNIDELYEIAKSPEHKNKKFLLSYQYESWPNGTPKKSLNGYTSQEILEMFVKDKDVPQNIVFHESYKPHLEKLYKNQNKQLNKELLIYEDNKTIDIKEENIVWTIDEDERNPEARHFAGAAKSALAFGAVPVKRGVPGSGIPRGFSPNKKTYALITKNLTAGVVENGITYDKQDFRSVSPEQIKANIAELYETARQYPEKKFLITYQYETWPNGSPKKSLNGYFPQELINFFMSSPVPDNIVFHDSYKDKIEAKYNNTNQVGTEDNKFTFFWLTDSPFSQWHPSIFEVKGVRFTSAEQFMMFCKAKLFKDEEIAQQILALNEEVEHLTSSTGEIIDSRYTILAKFNHGKISKEKILETPSLKKEWGAYQKKIKDLGRKVKNYDEKIWVEHREKYVFRGNYEKFTQNLDIQEVLLNTGKTILVEASPYDKIWGIGLAANDPEAKDPSKWKGLNLLGKGLTRLRDELAIRLTNSKKLKM